MKAVRSELLDESGHLQGWRGRDLSESDTLDLAAEVCFVFISSCVVCIGRRKEGRSIHLLILPVCLLVSDLYLTCFSVHPQAQ